MSSSEQLLLFTLTDRAQIEMRGADRQSFLHNFCTNDIKGLQPGQGCEAFLTNIKGRILGHIIVSATDESLWIDSVPGSSEFITQHLEKYIITEDVQITDRTPELGTLCLVGDQSVPWLQRFDPDIADVEMWGLKNVPIDGDVLLRRVDFVRQPAFELIVAQPRKAALIDSILESGVSQGTPDTFDALRIEAGFPEYGTDLTEDNIAQEAGRTAQAISFTKGCYLGQEPIARLDALGHTNRELRSLQIDGDSVPAPGTPLTSPEGQDAGKITSSALSQSGHPVALGMVKAAFTQAGTQLRAGGTPDSASPCVKVV